MIATTYLVIQGSYQGLQIALFSQDRCLQQIISKDMRASSHLILYINEILSNHNKTLTDLDFIAVDAGPGAFTSLRVVIATVNGISFDHKIPLVGINGLEALALDAQKSIEALNLSATTIVCLLNAYNRDAYYVIKNSDSNEMGCKKIDALIQDLNAKSTMMPLFVIGNGVITFEQELTLLNGEYHVPAADHSGVASLASIAQLGLLRWQEKKNPIYEITPYYLKSQLFAVKK